MNKRNTSVFSMLMMGVLALSMLVVGCDKKTPAETTDNTSNKQPLTVTVGTPKAPPILPILRMMETKAMGDDVDLQLDFWESPEQLIAMVQSEKNPMYALPVTIFAKLHNKGMDIQLINMNTWGVSYLVSSDPSVKTWADLKGKTLYVSNKTSPPDVMAQIFLKKYGLKKDDVKIVYAPKPELAQMMIAGKIQNVVTIEPIISAMMLKNPKVKVIASFQEEWQKMKPNYRMPTSGIAVATNFGKEHPEFMTKFATEYEKALTWVTENPQEAGVLAEKYIGMKQPIITHAIPNMGIFYKSAIDSKDELDTYYQFLHDFDPKTVGGKIPDESMYFQQK